MATVLSSNPEPVHIMSENDFKRYFETGGTQSYIRNTNSPIPGLNSLSHMEQLDERTLVLICSISEGQPGSYVAIPLDTRDDTLRYLIGERRCYQVIDSKSILHPNDDPRTIRVNFSLDGISGL